MKIFARYPWLQSVQMTYEGALRLNGFSLADIQSHRSVVNWTHFAEAAFEAARLEVQANGLLEYRFIVWRGQGQERAA